MTKGDTSAHRQLVRNRSEQLRGVSVLLMDRCRRAVAVATEMESARVTPPPASAEEALPLWPDGDGGDPHFRFDMVPVSDLFQIWVDHFGLSVMDAVQALAVQLVLAGYPIHIDAVTAADAIAMTHRVSERTNAPEPEADLG